MFCIVRILFLNEEINLDFTDQEVNEFKELWSQGISLENIAAHLKRKQVEIVLLIIDLHYNHEITPRKLGVFGI